MDNIKQQLLSLNPALLYEASVIAALTLALVFIFKFCIDQLLRHSIIRRKFWLKSTLKSAKTPIISFALLFGFTSLIDSIDNSLGLHLIDDFTMFKQLAAIVSISWFCFNLIEIAEENYLLKRQKDSKIDQATADILTKAARITTVTLVCLFSMQTLGFSVNALVAFAGGGGVVAGFAAKDLLANFFGALSIYLDKPFVVGDWIRSPDKEIEGIVEKIGLRITKIRTLDKRPLFVQNAIFNTLSIENITNMSHRRIKETIHLNHKNLNNLDNLTSKIENMLKNHEGIDQEMIIVINLESFSLTSASLLLLAFTQQTDLVPFSKLKQDVLLKVSEIIENEGCELTKVNTASISL